MWNESFFSAPQLGRALLGSDAERYRTIGFLLAILGALPALGRAQVRDTLNLQEASASFDLEDVRPFLKRLSGVIQAGFGRADIERLANRIARQPVDSQVTYEYSVTFEGRPATLMIVVFMDDIEAPDLAFFTHPGLAKRIDELIESYFEEVGK